MSEYRGSGSILVFLYSITLFANPSLLVTISLSNSSLIPISCGKEGVSEQQFIARRDRLVGGQACYTI